MNLDRNELMSICEDAVVPCADWHDRDSCSTQIQLSDIYGLLEAGAEFTTKVEGDTISIQFPDLPLNFGSKVNRSLDHDTREDYFNLDTTEEDEEMFEGNGLGYNDYDYKVGNYIGGYLPTRERLTQVDGGDWY